MYLIVLCKTIIDINIVMLCITFTMYNDISIYKKWMVNSNWLEKIFRFENLNLNPFEVQKL